MIYNFNTSTLIPTSDLIRAVRQFASRGDRPVAPTLDREQVLQAITLACADLDAADPLIIEHVIDTRAYKGLDSPAITDAIPATRPNVFAVYQPAIIDQDNLIEWDYAGPTGLKPRATITADSILALIKWPYAADAVTEVVATNPPAGTKAPVVAHESDPTKPLTFSFDFPIVDGRTIALTERVLIGNGSPSASAGIFQLDQTNEHEYAFHRTTDADSTVELNNAIVAVTGGSTYAGTVWQLADAGLSTYTMVQLLGTSFTTQRANLTRAQATAYIIPRAAAYLVHQVALATPDKTVSQHLIDWATALLARPIPITPQAISYRIQTATQYSNT